MRRKRGGIEVGMERGRQLAYILHITAHEGLMS
jgi:hypothetical protein